MIFLETNQRLEATWLLREPSSQQKKYSSRKEYSRHSNCCTFGRAEEIIKVCKQKSTNSLTDNLHSCLEVSFTAADTTVGPIYGNFLQRDAPNM